MAVGGSGVGGTGVGGGVRGGEIENEDAIFADYAASSQAQQSAAAELRAQGRHPDRWGCGRGGGWVGAADTGITLGCGGGPSCVHRAATQTGKGVSIHALHLGKGWR